MTTSRSSLRGALGDYLSLCRALGFQLASAGRLLEQFAGYLEAHGMDTVTTEHALAWAAQPAGASEHWQAIRLSVVWTPGDAPAICGPAAAAPTSS